MNNWPTTEFNKLYLVNSRNGLNRPTRVRGTGFKMINMGELFSYDRIRNPPMDLVPMSETEQTASSVAVGDLLFARQSLVAAGTGKCSIVLTVPELTTFESHLIRVRLNEHRTDPLFYYYYFSSHIGKANIQSLVMQVAAAGIRASELAHLQVPVPPLPTQRKIAAILSAYDELIENNARRIAILEEMAQALYREWFVHFRFPGHEEVPMVESALGPVPEGWQVTALRMVCAYINRGISPKYDARSASVVINQKCIRNDTVSLNAARKHATKVPPAKGLRFGDVLVNSTGIGTLGRVAQVYQQLQDCTVDSHVSIVRPNDRVALDYFGLYLLGLQTYFDSRGAGSTGQTELSRNAIGDAVFLLPPKLLQDRFADIVAPMRTTMVLMATKMDILRRTRDLLLPKLISGELDVEELDIATVEADV